MSPVDDPVDRIPVLRDAKVIKRSYHGVLTYLDQLLTQWTIGTFKNGACFAELASFVVGFLAMDMKQKMKFNALYLCNRHNFFL